MKQSTENSSDLTELASQWISEADCIIIGAGAGLSAAAGFDYSGERFRRYMKDLIDAYGIQDMYSGGFYPYPDTETYWAFFSRNIYLNRYMDPPVPVYQVLFDLVKNKNYFVLTTNVDHMFQKAGFDKKRIFYTQGDYGLYQTMDGKKKETWDNYDSVKAMLLDQGFTFSENGDLIAPDHPKSRISSDLIPVDPQSGIPLVPNLRIDETFVQDAGWDAAANRYHSLLEKAYQSRTLFLELGVGFNTPGIIKYPFQSMTEKFPDAQMVSVDRNYPHSSCQGKFINISGDLYSVLQQFQNDR